MTLIHLESYHIIPALVGGFILLFGLISSFVKERLFLSEALVAFLFGIVIGPIALGVFNPLQLDSHDTVTLELARIVIAIQVFAAGVSLPKKYLMKEWKSLTVLLLPVMFITWIVSGGIIYAFLPISFLEALVVASCITPTDPVLANSIVKGKFAENHVPEHVRDIISAESGANDGLGYPYLFFALYMLKFNTVSEALWEWSFMIWGYQIAFSIMVGIIAGYLGRKLLQYCHHHDTVDKESFLAFWLAMALFLMGIMSIIGSDDLFCCFVAGNAFTWDDWFRIETQEAEFQDIIDMIFNYSFFIYLGSSIPWSQFINPSIELSPTILITIAILIILFRRIPGLLLAKPIIPAIRSWPEAMFAGWFGPMGVGAIFYALVAMEELKTYDTEFKVTPYIYPTVIFMVVGSIVIHGTTIPLFYIGKHLRTRSMTTTGTITNFVTRLPNLRPGQKIVLEKVNPTSDNLNISSLQSNHDTLIFPDVITLPFNDELNHIVSVQDTFDYEPSPRVSFSNSHLSPSDRTS